MNILSQWLGEPLLYALGWTLLHSLWQCAAAAIALAVALKFIRPQAANKRYIASLLALVVCLASSIATFIYYAGASPQEAPRVIGIMPWGAVVTAAPETPSVVSALNQHLNWVVALWLVGSCVFLLRYSVNVYQCFHHKNHLSYRAPDLWQKRVNTLAERLKLNQRVILKISHYLATPCVIGHLKPVILLPVGMLTRLPEEQIEAILLHEMAHIRRHDFLIGLIQQFCKSLYFFNLPFLWICKQLDAERENACDDAAVACCGDPMLYARSLQQFSELSLQGEIAMAFNNQPKHLLARVKRIFNSQHHVTSTPQGFLSSLLSIIVLLCASFYTHSSLAGEKYPEITTLSDSAVESLMNEFKEGMYSGNNKIRIITSIELLDEFKLLDINERFYFSYYLRDNIYQNYGWSDMPRGEQWEHLSDSEWDKVKNIIFNSHHQQFFALLESPINSRETYNVDLPGYSQPIILKTYLRGRVELSVPDRMFADIASGKLEVLTDRLFMRIDQEDIVVTMSTFSTNEVHLKFRLEPEGMNHTLGDFSTSLHPAGTKSKGVFFHYQMGLYQANVTLSLAQDFIDNSMDTLGDSNLGIQASEAGTVDIVMQASGGVSSDQLSEYLPASAFEGYSKEELAHKIDQVPQDLKPYLLTDKDIQNQLRNHIASTGDSLKGGLRDFFTRLYQSSRADYLIGLADDQKARQFLIDNPETYNIVDENTWLSLSSDPMLADEAFDFEVEKTDFSQAVALAQAYCPGMPYIVNDRISHSEINLYGYDMTCDRLEAAFAQLEQKMIQKAID
ncbi:M56 family metallopeptidase [Gilvimarinus xylanilyticus]|uniref:M56 family metallopeptidase n=1 Tax=Gilvimarinus xylanilyticus TaxID=2944139 RepID=A0A9X2KUK3_9GAMM|nr:M56 family metallopeptidase [Gilvimarinus xylanilyticus]MCP8900357.1 M56 family metallopeptidase [Gilvimarinus xylanilyticus]